MSRALLEELAQRGIAVTVKGDKLALSAPRGVITPEVVGKVAEHKQELMLLLPGRRLKHPVSKALGDKQRELALRRSDLSSPYYQGDPWVLGQIALLEGHIAEMMRYLKEGGELTLPRCCRQADHICLAAVRGFNVCILTPVGCGYAHAAEGGH